MTGLALFRKSASVAIRTANGASNQAMRLGIPGSIRMMRPEQQSCATANKMADIAKITAGFRLVGTMLETVHMLQHFRQPRSLRGGGPLSSAAGFVTVPASSCG